MSMVYGVSTLLMTLWPRGFLNEMRLQFCSSCYPAVLWIILPTWFKGTVFKGSQLVEGRSKHIEAACHQGNNHVMMQKNILESKVVLIYWHPGALRAVAQGWSQNLVTGRLLHRFLVCMLNCPWARYWTSNCSWCAGRHLAWQPPPSVYECMYELL